MVNKMRVAYVPYPLYRWYSVEHHSNCDKLDGMARLVSRTPRMAPTWSLAGLLASGNAIGAVPGGLSRDR
jgi:hypothetical protein